MAKHRKRAVVSLGAAMYALLAAFGWQAEHAGQSDFGRALLAAALLFIPFMCVLTFLLRKTAGEMRSARPEQPFHAWRAFGLILLCYVPMFLITFPGSFAYDAPFQLRQVFTGSYTTHHPLLHTLLLGGCVALGRALGNINLGAALYTILQMTALAACFAGTCASLARSCGPRTARCSAVFFAIYPLHMCFAVNATKDVLFSGLFALTLALAFEAIGREKLARPLCAGLIAAGTGMMLLRNNAVYAAAVWTLVWTIALRRRGRRMALCMMVSIGLALGAGAGLKAATGATDGDLSEMLSWPIQQLARARLMAAGDLTQEERDAIDTLMPEDVWQLYDPTISDPVKFGFDTQALYEDPARALRTYLSVGAKCPKIYFDALLMHTYSFWYPYSEYGVSGYYLQMDVSREQLEEWCDFEWITPQSLLPRVLASLRWRLGAQGAMQIPVLGWLMNMGLIVWVMLFFVLREAYWGRWRRFAGAMLPVLLLGTYLLGPVMAGRYIYPFVCVLPVLAGHPSCRTA